MKNQCRLLSFRNVCCGKWLISAWNTIRIGLTTDSLTFFVRIFSAIDEADSSKRRSSMGGIDGPCSPCRLTMMNRTHRPKNRCNKFSATTNTDGLRTVPSAVSRTLFSPACCFVAIISLWNVCVNCRKTVWKNCSKNVVVIDFRANRLSFSSAFCARRDRLIRCGQKLNRIVFRCFCDCTWVVLLMAALQLLNERWKIATFNAIFFFWLFCSGVCFERRYFCFISYKVSITVL